MKKTIILISGVALALTSCDDNSWNDKLDGFDGNASATDVQNIDYTLTKADYGTIATLTENVALAGTEKASALAAIKNKAAFSAEIPAADYIPAFLANSKFPYFTLDNGSTVKVKYSVAEAMPAVLAEIAGASSVTISKEQCQEAWGSDVDFIEGFAPSAAPSKFIPRFLDAPADDASQYAMVTYNYSEQEPVFIGAELPEYNLLTAVAAGVPVIMVADGNAAVVDANKSYGYFQIESVAVEGDVAKGNLSDEAFFTFTATAGGYNIQDAAGRYVYMSGTYNSFNFSADMPDEGAVWAVTIDANGDAKILNVEKGKYIQFDSQYSSYGSYDTARGTMPKLYAAPQSKASRALAAPVATTLTYALYKYSNGSWAEDNTVTVLQPADFAQMGYSSNFLPDADASKYLPTFAQIAFPYAAKNESKTLAYFNSGRSVAAKQLNFNGTAWSVYNGVVERTAKFEKNNGVWGVAPGLATFTHSRVDAVTSGDRYLIVTGTTAATALETSKTYGYLPITTVESDEENVNLPDAEECEFTITETESGYTIQDRYGRYYYQAGTYNSFNVSDAIDGNANNGYYWDLTFNEDGTVSIVNALVSKTIQYDEGYKSYGSYATVTHALPMLYKAAGE